MSSWCTPTWPVYALVFSSRKLGVKSENLQGPPSFHGLWFLLIEDTEDDNIAPIENDIFPIKQAHL